MEEGERRKDAHDKGEDDEGELSWRSGTGCSVSGAERAS